MCAEYLDRYRTSNNSGFRFDIKGHKDEMHISAFTSSANLHSLRNLVQKLLLQFLGEDKSDKRLLFDLGVSSGIDVQQISSGGIMVKIIDPFLSCRKVWVTLIDHPMEIKYYRWFHSQIDKICKTTGCNARIYGDHPFFEGPLKLCSPYIFLYSKSSVEVIAAYNSIQDVIAGRTV